MADAEHDFYDEEVDIDQVEDAKDDGMGDESEFMDDEEGGQQADPDVPPADPSAAPAPAPQPGAPQ
jgi:hypothetical protein